MGKKILLVDDEPEIRTLYKKMLEKEGYTVSTAKDGRDALEKVAADRPDLIILDIMMPGMDGWEVSKKIKTDLATKDIPVVILSVKAGITEKVKSIEESLAERHLGKPVGRSELISTVKALLGEF
ncbi:MAG: response regulator [Methanobacteriota archaeon]|nr:MAG: response regulator [Euryarchaeota archaeon]